MLIKKITIENFRSIKDKITIWVNDSKMKTFVGPNNIGKSNILRAINLFFNQEVEPGMAFDSRRDISFGGGRSAMINMELQFNNNEDKAIIKVIDKLYKDEFDNYSFSITSRYLSTGKSQYIITNKKGQKKVMLKELQERILEQVNCIYIPAIKDYKHIINRDMMKKIVAITFQGWGRGRTSKKVGKRKEEFQNIMSGLQQILDSTGDYMSELMGGSIKGVKRFDFSLPYDNLEDFLGKVNFHITESGIAEKIVLDNEGSGVQSFTIFAMMRLMHEFRPRNTFRKSQFIWLIEEPETFMHHDLQRKTFNRLKEYSSEGYIFITSHSPVFIDKDNYNNCYHVTRDTSSRIESVTVDMVRKIISGSLGVSFQDMFMFNKYNLLVEGDTDRDLIIGLNKIFREMGVKDFLNFDELAIIVCSSANCIPHFYHLYNSFNQFANFYALFDRDTSGLKSRQELTHKKVEDKYLLLIPKSDFKANSAIEDIVDKKIWDLCLDELDKKGLIQIVSSHGKYVDYEYLEKDRVDVKKLFVKMLLEYAKKDISHFSKYKILIKNILDSIRA